MSLDIALRLIGRDDASQAINNVATAGARMGTTVTTASGKISSALNQTQTQAQKLANFMANGFAGSTTGLNNVATAAHSAADSLEGLHRKAETLRDTGIALTGIGATALVAANGFIHVAQESARADAKLEAMAKRRGEGGRFQELSEWASKLSLQAAMVDDDPIKEAAAGLLGFGLNAQQVQQIMPGLIGQARLYNQSLDSVAEAFGRAFASGSPSALKRSGVTISQADIDRIKNMTSETERQKATFDVVKQSMDQFALSITEGMSEGEAASNRLANRIDTLQTGIGQGAEKARTALLGGLLTPILMIAEKSPALQDAAGYLLVIGGAATTAGGSVLGLASQVSMLTLAFPGLATAAKAASLAIYAALAPVLVVAAAIGAALIALTAAAVAYQNRKARLADEEGDKAGRQSLEIVNASRRRRGLAPIAYQTGREDQDAAAPDVSASMAALQKAQQMVASGGASTMTTTAAGGGSGMATADATQSQLDAIDDQIAATTDKSEKKRLQNQKRLLARAMRDKKAADRMAAQQDRLAAIHTNVGAVDSSQLEALQEELAHTSDPTARIILGHKIRAARADLKGDKAAQKAADKAAELLDRQTKVFNDVAVARLEEQTATAIAKLESLKSDKGDNRAIELKIEQWKAYQVREEARLRARGNDSFAESGGLDIAGLRSQGILERARIAFQNAKNGARNFADLKMPSFADRINTPGLAAATGKMRAMAQGAGSFLSGGNASYLGGGNMLDPYAQTPNRRSRYNLPQPKITATNQYIELVWPVLRIPFPSDIQAAAQLARDVSMQWG